jgi:hypothetical protein
MAKPNFGFQKRQKELARKKKSEEKKQRKLEKSVEQTGDGQTAPENGTVAPETETGRQE